jgi:hypothetical protein
MNNFVEISTESTSRKQIWKVYEEFIDLGFSENN